MIELRQFFVSVALVFSLLAAPGCLTPPTLDDIESPPKVAPEPTWKTSPNEKTAEAAAIELETKLKQTPPQRDLFSLSKRLKGKPLQADARLVNVDRPDYEVGKSQTFWLADQQKKTYYSISATLRHKTPHAYFYVQDGQDVPFERLKQAGAIFENQIYRRVRGYFGSEPDPGIDNDPRITILHANFSGPPGYFSSADEYPRTINPFSNEREMIYINLRNNTPGTERYYSTIAHEFQHMIHWSWDSGEDTWVNEGLAELAVRLSGFSSAGSTASFVSNPNVQLNAWAADPVKAVAHYTAAYLFLSYLAERYGGYGSLWELVAEKAHGISGVERYLSKDKSAATFDEVFKDWVIANYLDNPNLADGRYGYRDLDVQVKAKSVSLEGASLSDRGSVRQYAANYLDLGQIKGDYAIAFTGTTTVKLLPNDARSGKRQWWSNRGDGMNTSLSREFDLTGLDKATLLFSAWYDTEKDFDYAYVEVSADGGETWKTLPGQHTTDSNPNGNNFGFGYTGKSGSGTFPSEGPVWVDERIDLSSYAGQKVFIRFEYITDDAYSAAGFAVDDIRIPELGYSYDAETEESWIANGFVLSDNLVPQRYYVQVIQIGPETTVQSVPLDENRHGRLVIHGEGPNKFVLVIAATALATLQPGDYEYSIERLP